METIVPHGLMHCNCCGKSSHFGRVDKIEQQVQVTIRAVGECHDCLNLKADAEETAQVKTILGLSETKLTENQNVNLGTTAPDNGSQANTPER